MSLDLYIRAYRIEDGDRARTNAVVGEESIAGSTYWQMLERHCGIQFETELGTCGEVIEPLTSASNEYNQNKSLNKHLVMKAKVESYGVCNNIEDEMLPLVNLLESLIDYQRVALELKLPVMYTLAWS